jgi:hypothetical protein
VAGPIVAAAGEVVLNRDELVLENARLRARLSTKGLLQSLVEPAPGRGNDPAHLRTRRDAPPFEAHRFDAPPRGIAGIESTTSLAAVGAAILLHDRPHRRLTVKAA